MEEKQGIEQLLDKIHIKVYDDYKGEFRSFVSVIMDLAKSWETLNDDYRDELYEAMGIMPSQKNEVICYPMLRREVSHSKAKDAGIEYLNWENNPTREGVK